MEEKATKTARTNKTTARTSGGGDNGTQRSVIESGPYDGSSSKWVELPYVEADPYELMEDKEEPTIDMKSKKSDLPLLYNDVHLLHKDNVPAIRWILNINEVRPNKRIRKLVGRMIIRRMNIIRLNILLSMASQQPSNVNCRENKKEEDDNTELYTLDRILTEIEEYACCLQHG